MKNKSLFLKIQSYFRGERNTPLVFQKLFSLFVRWMSAWLSASFIWRFNFGTYLNLFFYFKIWYRRDSNLGQQADIVRLIVRWMKSAGFLNISFSCAPLGNNSIDKIKSFCLQNSPLTLQNKYKLKYLYIQKKLNVLV